MDVVHTELMFILSGAACTKGVALNIAQLDHDPVSDQEAARHDPELADVARREHRQLRDTLAEPDVSFIVTPVAAEAHFMRDHDGVVGPAGEVERRRARMRREFGVDVV